MTAKTFEPEAIKELSDLESIRLLSDPLRLRLIQAFCEEERTTKQVAALLDEKPTRLYHHVDALESAGLIKLTRTRRVRGTVEKYYRSVALAFRADPRAFDAQEGAGRSDEVDGAFEAVIMTLTQTVATELHDLLKRDAAPVETLEEEGILSLIEVRASEKTIRQLRLRLLEILEDLQGNEPEADAESGPERRFRLMMTFYPLDR